MQSKLKLAVALLLTVSALPACASGFDDKTIDQNSINALQARIRRPSRATSASFTPSWFTR